MVTIVDVVKAAGVAPSTASYGLTGMRKVVSAAGSAGDDLWLSPCQGGDRVALHFTWHPRQPEVAALLPVIEERLAPPAGAIVNPDDSGASACGKWTRVSA